MNAIRIAALSLLQLFFASAMAQSGADWPSKPITIVSPYTPGASDISVRTYMAAITEATRWNFLIDYKPGANGVIAGSFVYKAAADGHTLLISSNNIVLGDVMETKPPYDGWTDFTPVFQLTRTSQLLVVSPSLPVKSVKEYIAYARANPGKINWGSIGANGVQRLSMEWLHGLMGVKVTQVPYKGGAPITAGMLAGEVQATIQSARSLLPQIKAGKIRPLALSHAGSRMKELPDLKSIAEEGVPGYNYYAWTGLHAPAATPPVIVGRLNAEFNKVLKNPDALAKFAAIGEGVGGGTVEEFRQELTSLRERLTKLANDLGVKLGAN
jgi:tripartite-type tricarboxylate transporter receptor subunit TctC